MVSLCFVSSEAIRYYDIFVLENGFLGRHISCLADNFTMFPFRFLDVYYCILASFCFLK